MVCFGFIRVVACIGALLCFMPDNTVLCGEPTFCGSVTDIRVVSTFICVAGAAVDVRSGLCGMCLGVESGSCGKSMFSSSGRSRPPPTKPRAWVPGAHSCVHAYFMSQDTHQGLHFSCNKITPVVPVNCRKFKGQVHKNKG